jgi:hypothetical protein
MNYTRGTDITSALKYMYQNKYDISTDELANCHSMFEVIALAEGKALANKNISLSGSVVEKLNAIGDFYSVTKSQNSKSQRVEKRSDNPNKKPSAEEPKKVDVLKEDTKMVETPRFGGLVDNDKESV